MGSISRYSTFNFAFAYIYIRNEPITGKPMDFTTEVEDEVIRDAVSHKLDILIVNPSNKFWIYSTQTKTTTSPYQIVNSIRYTNEVHNEVLWLVDKNTNDPDSNKFRIKFLRGNTMVLTKDFLKSRNVSDTGSLPIYPEDHIYKPKNLIQEQI